MFSGTAQSKSHLNLPVSHWILVDLVDRLFRILVAPANTYWTQLYIENIKGRHDATKRAKQAIQAGDLQGVLSFIWNHAQTYPDNWTKFWKNKTTTKQQNS